MANKFCRNISNTYRFNRNNQSELYYKPCCWVPHNKLITNAQSLVDAQREIAQDILKNPRVNCIECINRERTNFRKSGRRTALDDIPEDAVDGDPYILELQLDTNCNAACSICGPHFSSLWQKQLKIVPLEDTKINELHDQLINLISFDLIKKIKFFGGEPLLTESHLKVLDYVTNPLDCELLYSTNGSIFPNKKILSVWEKFKKVNLSFSIDAIQDQFEYIRWPLKWSRVESNLINVAQQLSNIEVQVHCTVNPMNVLYITELEQWIDQIQKTHNINIGYSFSQCYGVWGIDAMPPGLMTKILNQYPSDHPIIGIIKSVNQSIGKYKDLQQDMDKLDITRKLDWKKTFQDVAGYFSE